MPSRTCPWYRRSLSVVTAAARIAGAGSAAYLAPDVVNDLTVLVLRAEHHDVGGFPPP